MEVIVDELEGWDEIKQTAATGNPTSAAKSQANAAHKVTLALVNLGVAVSNHQNTTEIKLERLTDSIDHFNRSSGKLASAANWLAGALVFLATAQVLVAVLKH